MPSRADFDEAAMGHCECMRACTFHLVTPTSLTNGPNFGVSTTVVVLELGRLQLLGVLRLATTQDCICHHKIAFVLIHLIVVHVTVLYMINV